MKSLRRAAHLLGVVLCGWAVSGHATTLSANVAHTAVNVNPWTGGPAFSDGWTYDDIAASLRGDVPAVGVSLTGPLKGVLGIPRIGFAEAGATVRGDFSLELGYAVSGGRLNITYPGRGTVDIATRPGDLVIAGKPVVTESRFDPGLSRVMRPLGVDLSLLGGAGYAPAASIPGFGFDTFDQPRFQTAFPNAAAWMTLNYDIAAGLYAEAGIAKSDLLGCLGCVRREFARHGTGSVEIVNVNRKGVQVLGETRVAAFDQTFGLGAASLRVSYPDVSVSGQLQGDGRTLAGGGSRRVLEVVGNLEQLVPLVGPFLSQSVGPFTVKLLGLEGGPTFSLYQDFTVRIDPQVALVFNQDVLTHVGGQSHLTRVVQGRLGDRLDWTPLIGSARTDLTVQALFMPRATVTNHTGFSVGYQVTADALSAELAGLQLGPAQTVTLSNDLAIKLPAFFTSEFEVDLDPIALSPRSLTVGGVLADEFLDRQFFVGGVTEESPGLFRIAVLDDLGRLAGSASASGRLQRRLDTLSDLPPELLFIAEEDVVADVRLCDDGCDTGQVNLGAFLCVVCRAHNEVFAAVSPSFVDGGETLFINDLGRFRADETLFDGVPALDRQARVLSLSDVLTIGEPVPFGTPVPLPPTAWLFALSLTALPLARRGRVVPAPLAG